MDFMDVLRNEIFWDKKYIHHSKASERYVEVTMDFLGRKWTGWIPVEYRRTGLNLEKENEVVQYLNTIYEELNPNNLNLWIKEQEPFLNKKAKAKVTLEVFKALKPGEWICVNCNIDNPNWARRNQTIKEWGYTISTDTKRFCCGCKKNGTHLMLLPLKREAHEGNGYETISKKLRENIFKVLDNYNAYEGKKQRHHLLPDHKFPEIRWDQNTIEENPNDMSDDAIKRKFQLLDNQRNLHKREVCKNCYNSNQRGVIYGIPFFYKGEENWDPNIPKIGKEAEAGCVGCGWYDIEAWRKALIEKIKKE